MISDYWAIDNSSDEILYIQIFNLAKNDILKGRIKTGEKLPSIRRLSKSLGVSVTTVDAAYSQLLVEGYISSLPKSGYYVSDIYKQEQELVLRQPKIEEYEADADNTYIYDMESFDFTKWKKSMAKVFNEYSHLLHMESDSQGEYKLRYEIARYVYASRGVHCSPDQIVIGAGAQQLTTHLTRILRLLKINHVSTEAPGYLPIQNIFKDANLTITKVPIKEDGITIEKLPTNIKSLVYVSPSNQFPSGSVMPIGRRYELLKWADDNDSYILEDDYDSELRYFGRPIPALKSLDAKDRVIYMGSFSSTLFNAIKISYVILNPQFAEVFGRIKNLYSQTCSKSEQLCLSFFMEDGHYYRNIKKCRRLFSQKLNEAVRCIEKYGSDFIELTNTKSGINITLGIKTDYDLIEIVEMAKSCGVLLRPIFELGDENKKMVSFYYNKIPIEIMDETIKGLINKINK